ncbi:MAG TPA: L-rhamnose mutarotase [Phnomibacter sp.]|nr:L-rhamnose mutarotase [Phnomibacter sp.]
MATYCFTLDLKDDPALIAAYENWHQNVWPEIKESIRDAGISDMQIWRWQNRLFMMMETNERFSFEARAQADAENEKVQEWERLMWQYQQPLPGSKPGEKWQLMKKIFQL